MSKDEDGPSPIVQGLEVFEIDKETLQRALFFFDKLPEGRYVMGMTPAAAEDGGPIISIFRQHEEETEEVAQFGEGMVFNACLLAAVTCELLNAAPILLTSALKVLEGEDKGLKVFRVKTPGGPPN